MVRRIDETTRRREVAEAVWRILLRDGLDAASVRNVATEANLSTGSLRHFFTTQAGLHLFAMNTLSDRVRARIAEASEEPDVAARVPAMISELMPLRDDTETELLVWMEFVHRARFDEALAGVVREQADALRDFFVRVVSGQRELGLIDESVDVESAAAELNALVDGLTFELLTAPHLIDRDAALRIVAERLRNPTPRRN